MLSADPVLLTDAWGFDSTSSQPSSFVKSGGYIYFSANASESGEGRELWRSDHTAAGTRMVVDLTPGFSKYGSSPQNLTDIGGMLYFTTTAGSAANGLWKTDGTAAGTARVEDAAGNAMYSLSALVEMNGVWYFCGSTTGGDFELWRTDGTTTGTWRVKDVRPGSASGVTSTGLIGAETYFHVFGDAIYFGGNDGVHGPELWKSDGTEAGTVMVKDIGSADGLVLVNEGPWATLGGVMYFVGNSGSSGPELYRSDGTEAGTYMVKDIVAGAGSRLPSRLTVAGDKLFFNGSGLLYVTDGTAEGTDVVSEYVYGATSLTSLDGKLYFSSANRLMQSDGTAAGTIQIQAINPSAAGPRFCRYLSLPSIQPVTLQSGSLR